MSRPDRDYYRVLRMFSFPHTNYADRRGSSLIVAAIASLKNATAEFVGRYAATQRSEGTAFFNEIRAHKWIAARALLTGWGLWILSLVWFFPFVSRYFFIYKVPKPYPVTSPFASPDFFGSGVGVSFSLSDPIASAASVMWMPIAAPRGVSEHGLADASTFMFGIVLPFMVTAVCGLVVALPLCSCFGYGNSARRIASLIFQARKPQGPLIRLGKAVHQPSHPLGRNTA
jgi:hypothetical protein